MGPKKIEMMSRSEFEAARKEEDERLKVENQTLHDQVEARVQHNLTAFRTLDNYPLNMTNFNDLAVRKVPNEFVKKGVFNVFLFLRVRYVEQ